ncbi:class C beta-lactamase-related serine hydrolase [Aquimarina sp. BL5]|uniref:serine hydrolase domain-containing protein n=2 Tax=Aquimarina sp. BL5 TaxID=1714860 RepID=UPI000E52AD1E|nr:serine hydrolase [Aquimarina sp. BL5]AXT50890.1 class C beta-lactamase-related serine hydrolase [Aquimarina sp. BL5]RKN05589.1 class C beta-lactamase-related serine hydrolase [Aquimarina sp. BL5]
MFKNVMTIVFLFASVLTGCSQQGANTYDGNWEGKLANANTLNFNLVVKESSANLYELMIMNSETTIKEKLVITNTKRLKGSIDDDIHFDLSFSQDKTAIAGFVKSGILMYHVILQKTNDGTYSGVWNIFMVDSLQSQGMYLGVENNEDGSLAMYPFFGDQRFTGTWVNGSEKEGEAIVFRDYKTGLRFRAKLLENTIKLEILLGKQTVTVTNFKRSDIDLSSLRPSGLNSQNVNKPVVLNDGWITASATDVGATKASLSKLIDKVNKKELPNTHSVLIAKEGKLIFEAYFDGHNPNISHDQRSASKSVSSAMIGIAIDDKMLTGVDQKLYDFIPKEFQYTKDPLKSKINFEDLLTMSSGLDVDGDASENNYQSSDNWLKTTLEAKMTHEPGTHANYGSANPFLLGVSLDQQLQSPLELYMEEKLFAPLGITNYIIQTENTATTPYFGGGMYLTPRDMLKFGQLYLDKGKWKGKQIISESWIAASFKKYRRLQDVKDKNEYGYLWWHKTYTAGDKKVSSIEARGAGGQYICVIPELESVVVITSGNYRSRKLLQQPENILERYVLPAIIK